VRQNFTWEVIVGRFQELYQQILARPGRRRAINQ